MSTGELLPANPEILEGVDDLIQLSYLNEPSVLHNLHYRFSHDRIYVSTNLELSYRWRILLKLLLILFFHSLE